MRDARRAGTYDRDRRSEVPGQNAHRHVAPQQWQRDERFDACVFELGAEVRQLRRKVGHKARHACGEGIAGAVPSGQAPAAAERPSEMRRRG